MTDPIVIKGSKWFRRTEGSQFYIKGITYQDRGNAPPNSAQIIDSLADPPTCNRDIPFLKLLGVNTIFVSAVSIGSSHDICMKALHDAGIYVIMLLNGASTKSAWKSTTAGEERMILWDWTLYRDVFYPIIDEFSRYNNLLGYAFNMIDFDEDYAGDSVKTKAAARDVREYISSKKYRNIPIGAIGYNHWNPSIAQFMECKQDNAAVDFLGVDLMRYSINQTRGASYTTSQLPPKDGVLCYNTSMIQSGPLEIYKRAQLRTPLVLQMGCKADEPRDFSEISEIYANPDIFSGVILEDWFDRKTPNATDKGLVEIGGSVVKFRPAYSSIQQQFARATPTTAQIGQYTPTAAPPTCSPFIFQHEQSDPPSHKSYATNLPQRPNEHLCHCMTKSLRCVADPKISLPTLEDTKDKLCAQNEDLCKAVDIDSHAGHFGAYQMCNTTEKASWVFNQFHLSTGDQSVCGSSGGLLQKEIPDKDISTNCKIFLKQAGPNGTGTVTFDPVDKSPRNFEVGPDTLSTGKKVGIGIGVLSGVLVLAVFLIWLRKRSKRGQNDTPARAIHELPNMDLEKDEESPRQGVRELGSQGEIVEIDDGRVHGLGLYEMAGGEHEMRDLHGRSKENIHVGMYPEMTDPKIDTRDHARHPRDGFI